MITSHAGALMPHGKHCFRGSWVAAPSSPGTISLLCLAGGNGKVVGIDQTTLSQAYVFDIATRTWNTHALPNPVFTGGFKNLTFFNGVFVATRQTHVIVSPNGEDWTAYAITGNNDNSKLVFDGMTWFGVNRNNSSPKVITGDATNAAWSAPAASVSRPFGWDVEEIAFANGRYVAAGGTTATLAYTEDKNNWTTVALPASATRLSIVRFKDLFITSAVQGVHKSPSALAGTWEAQDVGLNPSVGTNSSSLVACDCSVVMVTPDASLTAEVCAYSYDGSTWLKCSLPSIKVWNNLAFDDTTRTHLATSNTGDVAIGR